jgi:hypothetical protein
MTPICQLLSLMRRSSFLIENRFIFNLMSAFFTSKKKSRFYVARMFLKYNYVEFTLLSDQHLPSLPFSRISQIRCLSFVSTNILSHFAGWGCKISFRYWWSYNHLLEGKDVKLWLSHFSGLWRFLLDNKWQSVVTTFIKHMWPRL